MLESSIQKSIHNYLTYKERLGDVYYIRNNSFRGVIERRNGTKGYIKNDKAGSPDFVVCYKGLWHGLEVKNEKGKQTDLQQQAQKDIERAGGKYFIVRSLEDVLKIIK